jgi:hypothetical protein
MPRVPRLQMAADGDAHSRPPLSTKGLKPTDLNPDEMDDVTMRIFRELRKQLSMMESKKAEELTTADRERHARILASLERTMERLANVEAGRAAARKSKVTMSNGPGSHEAFEARIDRIITVAIEESRQQRTG